MPQEERYKAKWARCPPKNKHNGKRKKETQFIKAESQTAQKVKTATKAMTKLKKQKGKPRPQCLNCGRRMIPVKDPMQNKITGYLWRCVCMPPGLTVSIG